MIKFILFLVCKIRSLKKNELNFFKSSNVNSKRKKVFKLLKGSYVKCIFECVEKTAELNNFINYFDFSKDKNIYFSSDYGGENDLSKYFVYTFTFYDNNNLKNWKYEIDKLRHQQGYQNAAEYKEIRPKSRHGKFVDWLKITESNFKGIVVSFAINKEIESLFMPTCIELHNLVKSEPYFSDFCLSPKITEKANRICCLSAIILYQILQENSSYFWMTDNDAIAQDPIRWNSTKKLHENTVRHFCRHLKNIKANCTIPLEKGKQPDYFSEDFLSLSDLFTGAIDDFTNNFQNKSPQELLKALKPKSIEILSYLKKLPTFVYILDKHKDGIGVQCTFNDINIVE